MPSESTPGQTRRDWEAIQENGSDKTERLRIVGGWLYRNTTPAGVALVFVPSTEADSE